MREDEEATDNVWIPRVRKAVSDRALWMLLLYRSFSEVLSDQVVEERMRAAIRQYGHAKGNSDVAGLDSSRWADNHRVKGSAAVFESLQVVAKGSYEQMMGVCPLVEVWREQGCTPEEVVLLCDIAMEGDRGRAEYHGLQMELMTTIAGGSKQCRLIITDPKTPESR